MRASILGPQRALRTLAALIEANKREKLYLYLVVSDDAVSSALVKEKEKV